MSSDIDSPPIGVKPPTKVNGSSDPGAIDSPPIGVKPPTMLNGSSDHRAGRRSGRTNHSNGNDEAVTVSPRSLNATMMELPNCQELYLSMLSSSAKQSNSSDGNYSPERLNISSSLQSELASTLSQMIQQQSTTTNGQKQRKKRKNPPSNDNDDDVIDLIDDSSSTAENNNNDDTTAAATGEEPANKRARLEDDDKFVNGFYDDELGAVNSELDKMVAEQTEDDAAAAAPKEDKTNNHQQQQEALEQQKRLLLGWFAERLKDLETNIQTLFQARNEALQAKDIELQQLRASNRELKQQLLHAQRAKDDSAATTANNKALEAKQLELEQQQKYAQRLEEQNGKLSEKLKSLEIHDVDKARVDKAQRGYLKIRSQIRDVILKRVPTAYKSECLPLLNDEIKQFYQFTTAVDDQMLLLQCQHFNERATDRNTIQDLEARLEQAAKMQQQDGASPSRQGPPPAHGPPPPPGPPPPQQQPQQPSQNPYLNGATSARINELTQLLSQSRESNDQLRGREARLKTANEEMKKLCTEKTRQAAELTRKLSTAELRANGLKTQVEMLRMSNVNQQAAFQQANNFNNLRVTQATAQLQMQQVVNSQKLLDRTLKGKQDQHEKEIRSTIRNHMSEMKSHAVRMEQMANTITRLSARNRLNEEKIDELNHTIHRLSGSKRYESDEDYR